MIQRIQTIFLFLAALAGVFTFFAPFWTYTGFDFTYTFTALGVNLTDGKFQAISVSTIPIMALLGLIIVLCFVSMFSYKNRKLQMKINSFNLFFTLVIIGTIFLWVPYMIKEVIIAEEKWGYGIFLPIVSFVFLLLANRFIKKDEKLVKAADRLR